MISDLRATLNYPGYHYLPGFTANTDDAEVAILDLVMSVSMPLHVFRNHPFWKPLPADTTRPRTRSGGIGLNSLHQDCVNLENPPDLIFFHCIRNDPAGGGTTLVCPTSDLEEEIAPEILEELARPVYMDGLAFVGELRALLPNVGIIVISGNLDEEEARVFSDLGVQTFLDKPFTQNKLVSALSRVLAV